MSDFAVETVQLVKDYQTGFWMRRFRALHPLDLQVHKGESFGFVGPNGAGKTTTIKILAGLQAPTGGEAKILGASVTEPSTRAKLGFLPERPYFYVHLTAREVLDFYGRLFGLSKKKRRSRISELLERTEMVRFADIPLRKYSKGMLQRIGLCQALIHEPELIILDEPMSGLDPLGRALVREIIQEQKSFGKTIFFCSHVLHDVQTICDRVGIIIKGRLQKVGSIEDLLGAEATYTDCVVRSEQLISFGELRKQTGDIQTLRIPSAQVNRFIDVVRDAGGILQELTPVRLTLEDLLIDEINNEPINKKHMGVW